MSEDLLRYDILVEEALREVVHRAMKKVADGGLPGEHHFYISFQTHFPGVELPPYLTEQYPDEMTIVLQYQFYGLTVTETGFNVMLSFNNIREKLSIPFAAITTFADPSVNFALQFQPLSEAIEISDNESDDKTDAEKAAEDASKRGEVISLDKFRKKQD